MLGVSYFLELYSPAHPIYILYRHVYAAEFHVTYPRSVPGVCICTYVALAARDLVGVFLYVCGICIIIIGRNLF